MVVVRFAKSNKAPPDIYAVTPRKGILNASELVPLILGE